MNDLMQQVDIIYKNRVSRKKGHTLGSRRSWGFRGSGSVSGSRVRRNGLTGTFSERGRSWRIRGLRVMLTVMAFGMKYLSRRVLGVRGEALGVLEEVLVVPCGILVDLWR